jgi:hypothetical protein
LGVVLAAKQKIPDSVEASALRFESTACPVERRAIWQAYQFERVENPSPRNPFHTCKMHPFEAHIAEVREPREPTFAEARDFASSMA